MTTQQRCAARLNLYRARGKIGIGISLRFPVQLNLRQQRLIVITDFGKQKLHGSETASRCELVLDIFLFPSRRSVVQRRSPN